MKVFRKIGRNTLLERLSAWPQLALALELYVFILSNLVRNLVLHYALEVGHPIAVAVVLAFKFQAVTLTTKGTNFFTAYEAFRVKKSAAGMHIA